MFKMRNKKVRTSRFKLSTNTIIKTLVENQAAIKLALNEVENRINQEFDKIKSKPKSISNRNHVARAKSNQEIKSINRYEMLYSDYESSETEDTSSDSESEISIDKSSSSIQKRVNKKTKKQQEQKYATNIQNLDIKEITVLRQIIRSNG